MGLLRVPEARPQVNDPGSTPAGMTSARCQPRFEGFPRRSHQLGSTRCRQLIARMNTEEMRDVAVSGLGFLIILDPFLQAAGPRTDLQRRQARQG